MSVGAAASTSFTYQCLPVLAGQVLTKEEIGQEIIRVIPEMTSRKQDFSHVPLSEKAWKELGLKTKPSAVLTGIEGDNITILNKLYYRTVPNDGGWITVKRAALFVKEKEDTLASLFVPYAVSSSDYDRNDKDRPVHFYYDAGGVEIRTPVGADRFHFENTY